VIKGFYSFLFICLTAGWALGQETETDTSQVPVSQYSLPDVVVTGEFEPTAANKAVHEVKVLDSERMQALGFQQLNEVLEQQLNLRVSQDASLGSGLTMQGIGGNNVQIMIDGVPVIGRLDGNIDLSQLPLYNVDRIEIVQGAMSNRYGSNAAGGVINLITKKNEGAKWSVSSQNQWEHVGTLSNTLGVSARFNRWVASASVFHFQSQIEPDDSLRVYEDQDVGGGNTINTKKYPWNPKEQVGGEASLRYFGKKSLEVGLSMRYFQEVVRNLGEVKRPQFQPYSFDEYFYTRRLDPRLSVKVDVGRTHTLNSVTAFNVYNRVTEDRRIDFDNDSNYVLENGQDTSLFTTLLHRSIFTGHYNETWKSEIGLEGQYETGAGDRIVDSTSAPYDQTQMMNLAGWVGIQWAPNDKWTIQPSVRVGWNSRFDHPLLPSIKAVYRGDKNLVLRAGYASGFRAPDLKEQYFEFVDVNHDIHGNPNLKAESAHNVYLSGERELLTNEAHSALIKGRIFYNYINDQITLAQTSPLYYEYVNVGQLWTNGVNAELDYRLYDDLTFITGVSYTRAKSYWDELTEPTDYIGTFDMQVQVTYVIPKIKTNLAVNYRYFGKQGTYFINEEVLTLNEQDPYNMTHVSLSRSFWSNHVFLSVGVKNLFDVQSVGISRVSSSVHQPVGNQLIGWGRTYFIKLNVNIGPQAGNSARK